MVWAASGASANEVANTGGQDDAVVQVVVTGSRIVRSGAEQPTPVTVLSATELTAATPNIGQALTQLPQLSQSSTLQSSNNQGGISQLNLRALGANRTLVLLDGRRLTPATTGTAPDINSLPQALIKRADIVTGGASAAYGSDAVAGVVNLILDTELTGLKGGVQAGSAQRGDNPDYMLSLTGGTAFAGGRGHIVASGEYYESRGALTAEGRGWNQHSYLPLPNPGVTATTPASASNPNIVIVPNAGLTRAVGGTILSGPLAGVQFGPGGVPTQFHYGQYRTANYMQGGDATSTAYFQPLTPEFTRWNGFTHATYDLTDNITAFGEVGIARSRAWSRTYPPSYNLPIYSGNAFLPASIQQQMTSLGLPSFTLGKIALDWQMDPRERMYEGGYSGIDDRVTSEDYLAGLKGSYELLGTRMTWNAYYQHGATSYARAVPNDPININLFNAIDAVTVTQANRGTSGLPLGSIACRTTLTNPNNGCIPLNVFGPGAGSLQALDYIYDTAWFKQATTQDAAALSTQGKVFHTWAGPVSMALGVEWRKVRTVVTSDSLSQTVPSAWLAANAAGTRGLPAVYLTPNPGVFLFGNYQPIQGSYNVKEVFTEAEVPLATDTRFAKSLELNGAFRYADYSISGGATTWKVGLTYEPFRGLRFRGTRSRDIRAPNIIELFSASRQSPEVITDPVNANAVYQVPTFQTGNLNLSAEKANTTTFGVVYQPSWLSGFMASIDVYSIEILGAITTLTGQQILDECRNGNTSLCGLSSRDPANNLVLQIRRPNINLATLRERGLDFELSYGFELGDGELQLRGIATYVDELSNASLSDAPAIDRAGEVGPNNNGVPHWSGRVSSNYGYGPLGVTLQGRYIGGGTYNNTYNTDKYNAPGVPITYINENDIPARIYWDLTARYEFKVGAGAVNAFATVNNLLDKDPPITPILGVNMHQTNFALYDIVGRTYTAGLKYKF
jgi:outer membrane receptor protein involved in Fe transport